MLNIFDKAQAVKVAVLLSFAALLSFAEVSASRGDQLDRSTNKFVDAVRVNLTMQGAWPPPTGSQQFQLCQALEVFSRAARETPDLRSQSGSPSERFLAVQRLQSAAASVDSLIGSCNLTTALPAWMEVKNQLNSLTALNGAATSYGYNYNSGFPGQMPGQQLMPGQQIFPGQQFIPSQQYMPGQTFIPGAYYPGFNQQIGGSPYDANNFFNSSFIGEAQALESDLNGFVSVFQKSLGAGGLTATDPNLIMNCGGSLTLLQNTVKTNVRALKSSNNFATRQVHLNQILAASDRFESAMTAASPSLVIQMRWNQYKQRLSSLIQTNR